jgi:hypothetical protein
MIEKSSEAYKNFVLLDYFQPKLCADIRAFLATAKNAEQLDIACRTLKDTVSYLVDHRNAELARREERNNG